jgi:hypothetical protein
MPKVGPRAATPETPRMKRDTMRRAALYNSSPVAPFLKPKLTVPVDEDSLVRRDTRGIPFASAKPGAQQMAERDRGFVQSAPSSLLSGSSSERERACGEERKGTTEGLFVMKRVFL